MGSLLRRIDWVNAPFVVVTHLMALAGVIAYAAWMPWSWATFALAAVWLGLCGLSITGGYHRLFSHMTYRAHWSVRALYLLFGAASVQNSALKWSADHRRHHQFTDEDQDPYNIKRGFWWAHIGWVLFKEPSTDFRRVPDLAADPLVKLQHRFYVPLAVFVGWMLPMLIAASWGDAIGAFFLCGWIRLVVQWHSTFCVNSLAHMLGRQPYSGADSSRDHFLTALVTMGEGYHNFHHSFPWDYRNGVRRHQFDPTKWIISAFARVGLTWELRRVPAETILKARLSMEAERMKSAGPSWDDRIAAAKARLEALLDRWAELKRRYADATRHARAELRAELKLAKAQFKAAYRAWRACLDQPDLLPAVA